MVKIISRVRYLCKYFTLIKLYLGNCPAELKCAFLNSIIVHAVQCICYIMRRKTIGCLKESSLFKAYIGRLHTLIENWYGIFIFFFTWSWKFNCPSL